MPELTSLLTSTGALRLSAALGSVAVVIGCFERLAAPRLLADGSLASWPVSGTSVPLLAGRAFRRSVGRLLEYPVVLGPVALCPVCGVVLALDLAPPVNALAAGAIAMTYSLLNIRSRFGTDGADQLTVITFASLALAFGVAQERGYVAVLWFLAAQACLAYLTAGAAKLLSPVWRTGAALPGILGTDFYGHPRSAALLSRHPGLATALCWSVIAFECCFPLALLGVQPLTYALVIGGVAFHIGTALLMRLNTFLWAFVAAYPAVLYCAGAAGS